MSPVSPAFYTEAIASIELKNNSENPLLDVYAVKQSTLFNNNKINCLTLSLSFYLGFRGSVDVEFQNEVKTLIHYIMENRIRRASGPVHFYQRFRYMYIVKDKIFFVVG